MTIGSNRELRNPARVLPAQFLVPLWRSASQRDDGDEAAVFEQAESLSALLCLLIQLARIRSRPLSDATGQQPLRRRVENRDGSVNVAVIDRRKFVIDNHGRTSMSRSYQVTPDRPREGSSITNFAHLAVACVGGSVAFVARPRTSISASSRFPPSATARS